MANTGHKELSYVQYRIVLCDLNRLLKKKNIYIIMVSVIIYTDMRFTGICHRTVTSFLATYLYEQLILNYGSV